MTYGADLQSEDGGLPDKLGAYDLLHRNTSVERSLGSSTILGSIREIASQILSTEEMRNSRIRMEVKLAIGCEDMSTGQPIVIWHQLAHTPAGVKKDTPTSQGSSEERDRYVEKMSKYAQLIAYLDTEASNNDRKNFPRFNEVSFDARGAVIIHQAYRQRLLSLLANISDILLDFRFK